MLADSLPCHGTCASLLFVHQLIIINRQINCTRQAINRFSAHPRLYKINVSVFPNSDPIAHNLLH